MSCETFLDHAPGFLEGSLDRARREAVVLHLEECADCRALLAALASPGDPGLSDAILARTSGAACGSARSRLCDRVDGALAPLDSELVDSHLSHCTNCAALARALEELRMELPRLAEIDPGPGFVESVLARTSRRPRRVPLTERWAAAVSRLLERPRIAFEGAFVGAVLLVMPLAVPSAPGAGRPAHALTEVTEAVHDIQASATIGARSAWAAAHVFVEENVIRLRQRTFACLGASGKQSGAGADDGEPGAAGENRR